MKDYYKELLDEMRPLAVRINALNKKLKDFALHLESAGETPEYSKKEYQLLAGQLKAMEVYYYFLALRKGYYIEKDGMRTITIDD